MNRRSRFCDCGEWLGRNGATKYCPGCIAAGRHLHVVADLDNAKTDATRRKILIGERGWFCWICELAEWRGSSIPLELDHIDGDHKNNTRPNLRVICPNCRAQTPTYKAKNKGSGRLFRRLVA